VHGDTVDVPDVNSVGQITTRRLGGIYELNRIATESDVDREPIAHLLASFVRALLPLPATSSRGGQPHLFPR
jgi:hypothetical protein